MHKQKTVGECLKLSALLEAESDSARLDVELLLAKAISQDRTFLYTWPEQALSKKELKAFDLLFERRKKGEPIAYILGEKEFWSRIFFVSPATLIPRDDTECLVEHALRLADKFQAASGESHVEHKKDALKILDLGTGTGAIGISLALELPFSKVDAVDVNSEAVDLAQKNASRLAANNITIFQSDWFSSVSGQYHLIVSNPPYIDIEDHHLNEGDVRFEPGTALVSGDGGLADIRVIAQSSREYLASEGWLLVEHGCDQGEAVKRVFNELGYLDVSIEKDLSGNDRFCVARFKGLNHVAVE